MINSSVLLVFWKLVSCDRSSETIADWKLIMSDIVDLYNSSPFGKCSSGGLLQVIDILIKLTGMNSDHCAKEKKDAQKMEKLKKWAVDQHLGESVMFEKSIWEINELYKKGEREMIRMAGGDNKWKALSPVVQAEKYMLIYWRKLLQILEKKHLKCFLIMKSGFFDYSSGLNVVVIRILILCMVAILQCHNDGKPMDVKA